MFCPNCGKEIIDEQAGCPFCAAAANESASAQQGAPYEVPNQSYQPRQDFNSPQSDYSNIAGMNYGAHIPQDRSTVTAKEYFDKYAPKTLKKNIKSICTLTYVLCAINLVLCFALYGNLWGIIDIVIIVAAALGMQLGKSKAFSILFLIVGILECVVGTFLSGSFSGWIWIVMGIIAVSSFSKIEKQYIQFKAENPYAQSNAYAPNTANTSSASNIYYTPETPNVQSSTDNTSNGNNYSVPPTNTDI